jgi:putative transcriptional regulator
MSKAVFAQISEGLTEALAVARGQAEPHKVHAPSGIDVKSIRAKTGLTQREFAGAYGFSLDQIKQWEQGRVRPAQGLTSYLMLIESDPEGMARALEKLRA